MVQWLKDRITEWLGGEQTFEEFAEQFSYENGVLTVDEQDLKVTRYTTEELGGTGDALAVLHISAVHWQGTVLWFEDGQYTLAIAGYGWDGSAHTRRVVRHEDGEAKTLEQLIGRTWAIETEEQMSYG